MPIGAFAFQAREPLFILRECRHGRRIVEATDEDGICDGVLFPENRRVMTYRAPSSSFNLRAIHAGEDNSPCPTYCERVLDF